MALENALPTSKEIAVVKDGCKEAIPTEFQVLSRCPILMYELQKTFEKS